MSEESLIMKSINTPKNELGKIMENKVQGLWNMKTCLQLLTQEVPKMWICFVDSSPVKGPLTPPCPPGQDWLPTNRTRGDRLLDSNRSPLPWKAAPVPSCCLPWAHSALVRGCSSLSHVCHSLTSGGGLSQSLPPSSVSLFCSLTPQGEVSAWFQLVPVCQAPWPWFW